MRVIDRERVMIAVYWYCYCHHDGPWRSVLYQLMHLTGYKPVNSMQSDRRDPRVDEILTDLESRTKPDAIRRAVELYRDT